MSVNVGVIGAGMIGQEHIRRITEVLSGARIIAVADTDAEVAHRVAGRLRHITVHHTGKDLIADDRVDAILVASWGPTHEEYVLAAIAAGKPVFCEKPLATTERACRNVIDAELATGRRLVQVGFMRRYDGAYQALKRVIDAGTIGAPLMYYSGHRNPSVPRQYTRDMAIVDTAIHDFDVARWLLWGRCLLERGHARSPRRSVHHRLRALPRHDGIHRSLCRGAAGHHWLPHYAIGL